MNVKDAILDASVALLKDKGIAALTQPQVAKAAGIKQSHLTYYFPTREDLVREPSRFIEEMGLGDVRMQEDAATAAMNPKERMAMLKALLKK